MSRGHRKRVVLYLRVSTDRQADEGHGLDAQRKQLADCAVQNDFHIIASVADEGESGSTLDRPGFQKVLALARSGEVDAVVTAKSDRVARNLRELLNLDYELQGLGVGLVVADSPVDTSTPQGRAMFQMQGAFAELERALIRQRTKEGIAAARAKGVRVGRPPVGFTSRNGQLVPKPGERFELVKRTAEIRASGMTLQQISDKLNAEGVPTGSGKVGAWHRASVARLLKGICSSPE